MITRNYNLQLYTFVQNRKTKVYQYYFNFIDLLNTLFTKKKKPLQTCTKLK